MGRAWFAAGFVSVCACMWIAMWPVQQNLFVCGSADPKVEFDPSFFWLRKLFPFSFNVLQMRSTARAAGLLFKLST